MYIKKTNQIIYSNRIKCIIDIMAYMPYNIYKGDYMTEFKLIAYEKENGEVPVEEFLDSINPKIFGVLGILQELKRHRKLLKRRYRLQRIEEKILLKG